MTRTEKIEKLKKRGKKMEGTNVSNKRKSIWDVYRRGRRYYIETRDGCMSVSLRLSKELNQGGVGYSTRREAEAYLRDWICDNEANT